MPSKVIFPSGMLTTPCVLELKGYGRKTYTLLSTPSLSPHLASPANPRGLCCGYRSLKHSLSQLLTTSVVFTAARYRERGAPQAGGRAAEAPRLLTVSSALCSFVGTARRGCILSSLPMKMVPLEAKATRHRHLVAPHGTWEISERREIFLHAN